MVSYHHVQYQKKNNDPILRKFEMMDKQINGQTDEWTVGQLVESDFIGHCPTNDECPKRE